jgi:hypothetical protein
MHTERKILANLAWRVYKARQKMRKLDKTYRGDDEDIRWLYHAEWVGLHNAFNQAKQIYFDNLPKD